MSEPHNRPASLPNDLDEIPVEELIRLTREFTRRITNQDRQRLGLELRESGHQRSIQTSAPITLQQFFSGEIDLDTDLARRFSNTPLLSRVKFFPPPDRPLGRRATAIFASNDDALMLSVDAHTDEAATLDFTFTLFSVIALRFRLSPLVEGDRSRWLDLMRRANGITFLWTRERWEQPHLIFVVREHFGRVYAFSPAGYEAAARMTPQMITELLDWLEDLWFPGRREEREAQEEPDETDLRSVPIGDWAEEPLHFSPRQRGQSILQSVIPDAPEEQWEEAAEAPSEEETAAEPPSDEFGDEALSADDLEW